MYGPDWAKTPAERQRDAIAAKKQRDKLAKVRKNRENKAQRRENAHLN